MGKDRRYQNLSIPLREDGTQLVGLSGKAKLLRMQRISPAMLAALVAALAIAAPHAAPADPAGAAAVVKAFVDAFNRHDLDASLAFFGDPFREVFPDGNTVLGKQALRDHIALQFAADPRMRIDMQDLVGNNDTAAAELSFLPDARAKAPAPEYAYVFTLAQGRIVAIAVYTRSQEAQKAAARPWPGATPK